MQWTKRICAMSTGVCLGLATLVLAPTIAMAESPESGSDRLAACDHYMGAYVRSASRKLGRSLAGQKYQLEELESRTSLEASIEGDKTREFEVIYERDQTVAGLVEKTRTHRNSYIVTHTSMGPVVTRHVWPEREAISSGEKECLPLSSSIMAPEVPVAPIDIEPFKFWGLRVVWHLPKKFPKASHGTKPFEALRNLLARTSDKRGADVASSETDESDRNASD